MVISRLFLSVLTEDLLCVVGLLQFGLTLSVVVISRLFLSVLTEDLLCVVGLLQFGLTLSVVMSSDCSCLS